MKIDVRSNIKEVSKTMSKLDRQVIPKATVMGLNKGITNVRTQVVRRVSKTTGIKQKHLRQLITVSKAGKVKGPVAVFALREKYPNLIRFNARKVKLGVSATAWGFRKIYEGAFIGNKGRTVFARETKKNLPIEALPGPSAAVQMVREKIDEAVAAIGIDKFNAEFQRQIQRFINSKRSRK